MVNNSQRSDAYRSQFLNNKTYLHFAYIISALNSTVFNRSKCVPAKCFIHWIFCQALAHLVHQLQLKCPIQICCWMELARLVENRHWIHRRNRCCWNRYYWIHCWIHYWTVHHQIHCHWKAIDLAHQSCLVHLVRQSCLAHLVHLVCHRGQSVRQVRLEFRLSHYSLVDCMSFDLDIGLVHLKYQANHLW